MKLLALLALAGISLLTQLSFASAPVCSQYAELTSNDRQLISDTRYALESIDLGLTDEEFNSRFKQIIHRAEYAFSQAPLPEHLQGLIAEGLLRRQVHQTIGTDHLAYKRFQIFADLILYHKAMDHKGFVKAELFLKTKNDLVDVINAHFEKQEEQTIALFKAAPADFTQILTGLHSAPEAQTLSAKSFVELEGQRQQMLGALEISWQQLLRRNQSNQSEVLADIAVTELSLNAAVAVTGFVGLIGYGPSLLGSAQSLWAMPISAAIGCGFGMSSRAINDRMTASYLQMSRALYLAVKNKTKFSCELGEQVYPTTESEKVTIPYEKPPGTTKDYVMACAGAGSSMIFPKTVGISLSGLFLVALASTSYQMVKESAEFLTELPRLYKLKEQLQHLPQTSEQAKTIADLEAQIHQSQTKITLYLLALGNSSIEAFRQGLFLYGNKEQFQSVIKSSREFIAGKNWQNKPDLHLMSIILTHFPQ